MILWLTALLFVGLAGLLGYRAGAIRVAFSLVGLLLGAALAMPLGKLIKPVVSMAGVHHPLLLPIIAPLVVFLIILIGFKIAAQTVHYKASVYYEFKANDTQRARWERVMSRLGLCLGLLNGVLYFILAMIPVYVAGYFTLQAANTDDAPKSVKVLNMAREQVHSSNLDKFLASYDPAPEQYYDATDILALIQRNPIAISRLQRYPSFLSLAERPEMQALAADSEVNDLIQRQSSIGDILKHPKVQAIVTNADVTSQIGKIVGNDLKDLKTFLETGKSAKYDSQKLLGRWRWDRTATINTEKKAKASFTAADQQRLNARIAALTGAQLVVMIDNKVIVKREIEIPNTPPLVGEGSWKEENGGYSIQLTIDNKPTQSDVNVIDDSRISFVWDNLTLFFDKEE